MNTGNTDLPNNPDDQLATLGWLLHAGGCAVSIVILAALFVGVFRPLVSEGQNVQLAIESAKMYLTAEAAIAARHADATAALAEEQRLEADRATRIPAAARESELLAQLTELSRASAMEIVSYQPAGSARHGTIHALSVDLKGSGTYEGVCRFLAGLESLPRLCHLTRLSVVVPPQSDALLELDVTLQVYYGSAAAPPEKLARSATEPGHTPVPGWVETSPGTRVERTAITSGEVRTR